MDAAGVDAPGVHAAPVAQAPQPGFELRREGAVGMRAGHRRADAGRGAHGGHRRRGRTALMVVGRPADQKGGAERRQDAHHCGRDQSHGAKGTRKRSRTDPDGQVFTGSVAGRDNGAILRPGTSCHTVGNTPLMPVIDMPILLPKVRLL